MPVYTYRRDDGTTFDFKQGFLDDPLTICPTTGQSVIRVVQAAGIIFKGSGFYVNDSRGSKKGLTSPTSEKSENGSGHGEKAESKTEGKSEGKGESAKSETKAPTKAESAAD